ncbi:DUF6920 family protein [Mucilaginibacter boryungensis]|uniref:Uncharacterized protein n=1 Tax=Mucilaginibacter boryungensis TaxID=768480 RepID=A0ABR9XN45_9SPHI|nr:DUF6544 family protein [Mucilaginibacter boryungensis]MBE9668529.1 hypothetical protein [Mucilaginibacter boryungensis]
MIRKAAFLDSLSRQYEQGLAEECEKYNLCRSCSADRLVTDLPPILQRYLSDSGYIGKETLICCQMVWKEAALRMHPGSRWTTVSCRQINFLPSPARLVLMRARLFGFLPFTAQDIFQDGHGGLLVRLLDKLRVAEGTGPLMDRSELVTVLAEMMIIPAYALCRYITWREIDPLTIEGTISIQDVTAKGIFYFNTDGLVERFETLDRYYNNNGTYQNYPWVAMAEKYKVRGDIRFPSVFQALWKMPGREHVYFKGEIARLQFNSF